MILGMLMKRDRERNRREAVRILLIFGWCMLLYEMTSCPTPAIAQDDPIPYGAPTRRRQTFRSTRLQNQPETPVTLVSDENATPTPFRIQPKERMMLEQPTGEAGEEMLPINLPAALRLAGVQAWDIAIAVQQLRIASAQLQGAKVIWVPSIIGGIDYVNHNGPFQKYIAGGAVSQSSFTSVYPGIAPLAVFASTDAIFTPLAQNQVTIAQRANVQTATNDILTSLALTYFSSVEARGDLAAIDYVVHRMELLVRKTVSLAPDLVPELEVARVKAALAAAEEAREIARRRWRVTGAEVARVVRLKPTVLIAPLESPQLQMTLISPEYTPDELVIMAVENRPEMTFNAAQAEAARYRMKQEKWRPLLPILLVRGSGTQYPYPMAFGGFAGGPGGTISNFKVRSDFDMEAIWELKNLGFGNRALIRRRKAEYDQARIQAFKIRDIIAREVTQTYADIVSAKNRIGQAERELREAQISAEKNLEGLGETKRVEGNIRDLVIRPLEAVVAQQVLSKAYYNYYGAIADYNRSQFRMYRALGNPAQALSTRGEAIVPTEAIGGPNAGFESERSVR